MLDFDRMRFGDVQRADGSLRSGGQGMRRMLYSPDPPDPFFFEDCEPETRRRKLEAFADAGYARASDGESGRRVGMCAFQFTTSGAASTCGCIRRRQSAIVSSCLDPSCTGTQSVRRLTRRRRPRANPAEPPKLLIGRRGGKLQPSSHQQDKRR
jgi:hypothetical protein